MNSASSLGLGDASDEECAARAQAGDESSLAELVRRYTPGVFNVFARAYSNRDMAADDTQEVFLRVHKNLRSFDTGRSFKTWIFTI
ncbi:MAG: sigma factor, partial [Planctomycetota bacterium]